MNISLDNGGIHYLFIKEPDTRKAIKRVQDPFRKEENASLTLYRLDLILADANPTPFITAEEWQPYHENYYLPGCGEQGITQVHSYSRIVYHDIYPQIDWIVYTKGNKLKYDFIVHPGGKISDIRLQYEGGDIRKNKDGSITTTTPFGSVREEAPYAYVEASKEQIPCDFALRDHQLSFKAAPVNGTLVIDPSLIWATYYGGSYDDRINDITCDTAGNVFITGMSNSVNNIATSGSHQSSLSVANSTDIFLAKFNKNGVRLWATYYGDVNTEQGRSVACDPSGNVYIAGSSGGVSSILATPGSYQPVFGGSIGTADAVLAKFNNNGIRLWATYYGATGDEVGWGVACNAAGDVFMAGSTTSASSIASSGSYQPVFGGNADAFLVKFSSTGVRQWATYYGGAGTDYASGIICDASGNVFMTGSTNSDSNIATAGAQQVARGGNFDLFLAKFNASGVRQWGTYYGGPSDEQVATYCHGLAGDSYGNIYLGANTFSTSGIASAGAHQTAFGGFSDGLIVKFNNGGIRQWATYYGGTGGDGCTAISCDGNSKIYCTGSTHSNSGISTPGSLNPTLPVSFGYDAFLAEFDTAGVRIYGTYYGGGGAGGFGVACDGAGSIYFGGMANDNGTPNTTPGAHQPAWGGWVTDGFLARFYDSSFVPPFVAAITLPAAHMNHCMGDTFALTFQVSGSNFYAGNIFTAELSDALGSFATPTPIGTLAAVFTGTITCILPAGVTGNRNIRIVSSNPYRVSTLLSITVYPLPNPTISRTGNVLSTGSYFSYQWYRNGTAISSATAQSYILTQTGNYQVSVTDSNGCKKMAPVFAVQTIVGIGQVNPVAIRIWPNPAADKLYIESPVGVGVVIRNMQGQVVLTVMDKHEVDISALADGVYTVVLFDNKGVRMQTQRLIKMGR